MKCFVTGAAGYIGNALVNRLINEGHEVIGLIHHHQPSPHVKSATYISGDITQKNTYDTYLPGTDIIFHSAAYVKDYGPPHLFKKINVQGTQTLATLSQQQGISRFIYLGHIQYETPQHSSYSETKQLAEQYLYDIYQQEGFPVVVIRPGNVFGPGPATWVLRPIQAIQKNRIALINDGNGIFHHTYIDNLIDGLLLSMNTEGIEGKQIDITDGDTQIRWKHYFNDLATIMGKPPITKKLSKNQALLVSKLMMLRYFLFHQEPWITTFAINIFTNTTPISIKPAQQLLGYTPKIDYTTALKNIKEWISNTPYQNKKLN